jgi:hypothetical protein
MLTHSAESRTALHQLGYIVMASERGVPGGGRAVRGVASFAVAAGVVLAALGAVSPAYADPGGQSGGPTGGGNRLGAQATYTVHLTGDLKGGTGSGSISVGVPPTCWWGSTGQDATQFDAWYTNYQEVNKGFGSEVWYGMPGHGKVEDAMKDQQGGHAGQWYAYQCRTADTPIDTIYRQQYGLPPYPAGGWPVFYQWIRNGDPVPPGYVAPVDLVEVIMRYIRLLPPEIGRSPGGDAVTQLATWLWVSADDAKIKHVRADAGPAWAEVTAPSQGIQFSAPYAGSTTCAPGDATTRYAAGATSSCTLTWTRASWEGSYTLTATNSWYATFVASDGTGGPVPNQPAPQTSTEQVRVVETQVIGSGERWAPGPR